MTVDGKSRRLVLACWLFVLTAGVLRLTLLGRGYVYHGVLSLCYLAVYFVWMQSIRQRFLQRDMRRILTSAAYLMIFWGVLRLVKYEFTVPGGSLSRQLWYGYYIPIVLLPLLLFLATLYIGKTDGTDVSRRWKLLYIPAAAVVLGILTNDLHQLAFRFLPGFADWNRQYTHGPLYYAAAGLAGLFVLGALVVVFQKCSKRRFLRYLWLPLLVAAVAVAYYGLYATHPSGPKPFMQRMYELPEFTCFALIVFWETLVFTHMIPSNMGHETFFRASSLRAGLTDRTYAVVLRAPAGVCPTPEQTRAAEEAAPVFLDDGSTLLKSRPVRGGHFYWTEDVRELNRLNRELADAGDYLAEEHAMLDAAAKLEESRVRTAEQNRLYDLIAKELQPQLDALSALLEHLPEDEAAFRRTMLTAGVLNAYVKRRSNLLLLANQELALPSDELSVSISESLEYVRLLGIPCHAEIEPGVALPSELALLCHALFEAALEAALPGVRAVLAALQTEGDDLRFYLELARPATLLPDDWQREELARLRASVQTEWSDGSACITLRSKRGGAAQ